MLAQVEADHQYAKSFCGCTRHRRRHVDTGEPALAPGLAKYASGTGTTDNAPPRTS